MPETEQQQAAAPAANDTSTSWNLGDFAKGFGSPLTKNENGTYNVAGALLTGAGTGLAAWFLSRVLGIKSGPSLGISILAGLAGAHGAFTKQGGLDFFSNPKGYLKDFMDSKRAQPVDPNGAAAEEMRAQQEEMPKGAPRQYGQEAAAMDNISLLRRAQALEKAGQGDSPEAMAIKAEQEARTKALRYEQQQQQQRRKGSTPANETETTAMVMALDDLRRRESYVRTNFPGDTESLRQIEEARQEIQAKMAEAIRNDRGPQEWNNDALMQSQRDPEADALGTGKMTYYPMATPQQLMESQKNPEADSMGNGSTYYPSIAPGKDLQKALRRGRYVMMDSVPWRAGVDARLAPVYGISPEAKSNATPAPRPFKWTDHIVPDEERPPLSPTPIQPTVRTQTVFPPNDRANLSTNWFNAHASSNPNNQ